jgi:hypothetical protein
MTDLIMQKLDRIESLLEEQVLYILNVVSNLTLNPRYR